MKKPYHAKRKKKLKDICMACGVPIEKGLLCGQCEKVHENLHKGEKVIQVIKCSNCGMDEYATMDIVQVCQNCGNVLRGKQPVLCFHDCNSGQKVLVWIGTMETPRGTADMYACPGCTRLFFFADFDFNPETGGFG